MKKTIAITTIVLAITIFFVFSTGTFSQDELDSYDKRPAHSTQNMITLYNDGCCFVFEDFSISIVAKNKTIKTYELFSHESPEYRKEYNIPVELDIDGSIEISVSFYYEYLEKGKVAFSVMSFDNIEELKTNGLLLMFGDGDVRVSSEDKEAFFQDNVEPWVMAENEQYQEPLSVDADGITFSSRYIENEDDRPEGQLTFAEAKNVLFPDNLPDGFILKVHEVTSTEIWVKTGVQIYSVSSNTGMTTGAIIKNGEKFAEFANGLGSIGFSITKITDYNSDGVYDLVYSYTWGSGMIRTETDWIDLSTGEIHFIADDL